MKQKHWVFSLFGLYILSQLPIASAGGLGNSSSTPKDCLNFGFNLTGYYLLPGASNLTYAVHTQPLPVPSPSWSQVQLKPDFHPAFDLSAQYHFPIWNNTAKLDWFHFDAKDSTSAQASGSTSIAPPYYFGPGAQAIRNSSAEDTVQFKVDQINLVFSHTFTSGAYLQLIPFAGIGSAYLKQSIATTYRGRNTNDVSFSNTVYNISKHKGVGPRLGFDVTSALTPHFSVLAGIGSTLLVGSMKSSTNFLTQGEANPTAVKTALADISQTKIVPEIDSKLAVSYSTDLNHGCKLQIQLGYMYTVYIDGINQVLPTNLVPNVFNDGTIAIETAAQAQSNLDLNGPYIKLVWLA